MRRLAIVIIVIFAVFTLINAYTREAAVPQESTPADPAEQEMPDALG
jgi:hypothetical protein